jgi:hypothetical protein
MSGSASLQSEEIPIGRPWPWRIALHRAGANLFHTGQRTPGKVHTAPPAVDELLKFRSRCVAVVQHQIGFSTYINGT